MVQVHEPNGAGRECHDQHSPRIIVLEVEEDAVTLLRCHIAVDTKMTDRVRLQCAAHQVESGLPEGKYDAVSEVSYERPVLVGVWVSSESYHLWP